MVSGQDWGQEKRVPVAAVDRGDDVDRSRDQMRRSRGGDSVSSDHWA